MDKRHRVADHIHSTPQAAVFSDGCAALLRWPAASTPLHPPRPTPARALPAAQVGICGWRCSLHSWWLRRPIVHLGLLRHVRRLPPILVAAIQTLTILVYIAAILRGIIVAAIGARLSWPVSLLLRGPIGGASALRWSIAACTKRPIARRKAPCIRQKLLCQKESGVLHITGWKSL